MSKISILLLWLIVTMVAGCGNNAESNKANKQVISGNSVQNVDSRSENPKMVKKVERDAQKTGYVLKDTTLYDEPDGQEIRNDITKGRVVTIIAEQGDWSKILIYTYDTPTDNIGWVKSAALSSESKSISLREGRLNMDCTLMDGPPSGGKELPDKVYAGQQVFIEERRAGWVRCQFAGGLNGWIPEKYIEFIGPDL